MNNNKEELTPIDKGKSDLVLSDNNSGKAAFWKELIVSSEDSRFDTNGMLSKLMQYANIADAIAHVERSVEYVVQIPVKYKEAFKTGKVLLNQNSKTDVMWPTLYERLENGKRRFVDNLPIKEEEIIHGNPFESIAISTHNLYMQQQVSELADALQETYQVVRRIERGQLDDRIGLLEAGRDVIRYALNTPSDERNAAMAQGRNNIIIAQKQLLQTLKSRVKGFEAIPESAVTRFTKELFHTGFLRRKDEEFEEIQQYFSLYLQSTQMLAASYALCGDLNTAEQVFIDAEQEMKTINFESLQSLQIIHKDTSDLFYDHADEFIATERELCLEDARDYDSISIQVTGEQLLEVFKHERAEAIPEPNAES